ncbi:MAG: extracellular solute-binding protein [Anaerolineae bacterium]|nr:extracellular solute-binding protein [Anaerolineae bacterium]
MTGFEGQMVGEYKIVEMIGSGGMANVYRAYQAKMEREVAIKILPAYFMQDDTFIERFNREARVIARLEHPSILPVHDFGQFQDQPYLVMRYVSGVSLLERIQACPQGMPLDEVQKIVDQMASALDFAHKRGIIHRDVKPSNVLIDEDGNAYLADFGIAKVTGSTLELTGSGIVGTPGYIAPEMTRRGGMTSLVDVYALGVTLFEMLTGQRPYEADTPMGTLVAHATEPIPDIREFRPDLPAGIETVIETVLAKEPEKRYPTACALAEDLGAALAGAYDYDDGLTIGMAKPAAPEPESVLSPDTPPTLEGATRQAATPPVVKAPVVPEPSWVAEAKPRRRNRSLVWVLGIGGTLLAAAIVVGGVILLRSIGGQKDTTPEPSAADQPVAEQPAVEQPSVDQPADEAPAPDGPVEITWFVELGGQVGPNRLAMQEALAEAFNSSHDDIHLNIKTSEGEDGPTMLATMIAAGTPPDIVGPVGLGIMNQFYGEWLDLTPYIEQSGIDTSAYNPALMVLYNVPGQGQVGLPYIVYPPAMFYNADLFDRAGLCYPPHHIGEPYCDGDPWTWDKVREIAMLMTYDANGNDAMSQDFDPGNIVQYGLDSHWNDARGDAIYVGGAGTLWDGNSVVIPGNWREAWLWQVNGIWVDHFMPSMGVVGEMGGNPFAEGKAAMYPINSWYFILLTNDINWDMAALPATFDGRHTTRMHADTFFILKESRNPQAAWETLVWMRNNEPTQLFAEYSGLPARDMDLDWTLNMLSMRYDLDFSRVDLEVLLEAQNNPEIASSETYLPNNNMANGYLADFYNRYHGEPVDMDTELANLQRDLEEIFAGGQ